MHFARRTGLRSSRMLGRRFTHRNVLPATRHWRRSWDFRGFGDIQGCPSRNKDSANVDCLTGSIGLGVAINAFASLVQDYVRVRGRNDSPEGRVVASSRPGAVHGHREAGLGVEHSGKAEDVSDPWRHFGIDRNSILRAIESLFPGRSLRAVGGLG